MHKTLTILFLTTFSNLLFSQDYALPSAYEAEKPEVFQQRFKNKLEYCKSRIKTHRHRKELIKAYEDRKNELTKMLEQEDFIFQSYYQSYLEGILSKITQANPLIRAKDIDIFISRSASPNALSYGDGTLILNIGLLRRLENEAQLAFVLCHEIAHYSLRHLERKITKRQNYLEDEDVKKILKKIKKKKKYDKEKAADLLQDYLFSSRHLSRETESEADSIGYLYFSKTSYAQTEAVTLIQLLENIDKDKFQEPLDYQDLLGSTNMPFKASWLAKEEVLFGGKLLGRVEQFDADSLRTHPACKERALALERRKTIQNTQLNDSDGFTHLVDWADIELAIQYFDSDNIGRSLQLSLYLLEKYPSDDFLVSLIAENLLLMQDAITFREIGLYIEHDSPYKSESYNNTLRFLNQIRKKDLQKLTFHFIQKNLTPESSKNLHLIFLQSAMYSEEADFLKKAESSWETAFPKENYKRYFND